MKTDLVVAGYLIHKGRVLLIHHKKLDMWLPPGGHIEKDEDTDQAVKREFKEELGLDVEILNTVAIPKGGNVKKHLALPFYANVHSVGNHDHCCFNYLCTVRNSEGLTINKDELNDAQWFSKKELYQTHIPADVRNIALKAFELVERISKK